MVMKISFVQMLVPCVMIALSYTFLHAQSDYLVLTKGDTLYGKVTHLSFGIEQKVQLMDEHKKKSVYSMLQVKSFQMNDEIYHLIKLYDTYKYMKLIQSGYLSSYAFQQDNQVTWDGRYLYKMDGRGIEVPNIGFKKKMSEFLEDCPETVDDITSGNLNRNTLEEILNHYNACIEKMSSLRVAAAQPLPQLDVSAWQSFETEIRTTENLSDKETLLEMVGEAKAKAERGEKIPNFLLSGIKKSIEGKTDLEELLTKALRETEKKE